MCSVGTFIDNVLYCNTPSNKPIGFHVLDNLIMNIMDVCMLLHGCLKNKYHFYYYPIDKIGIQAAPIVKKKIIFIYVAIEYRFKRPLAPYY